MRVQPDTGSLMVCKATMIVANSIITTLLLFSSDLKSHHVLIDSAQVRKERNRQEALWAIIRNTTFVKRTL